MSFHGHSPISRRGLLGGALGGALAAAAGTAAARRAAGAPAAPTAAAATGLPLTVVNNTGAFANTSIRLYIVGSDGTGQVRVTPEGEARPVSLADNGPDGFTDYAIPLSAGGTTVLSLPPMSGRIYVALGDRLKFRAVRDGDGNPALAHPAGWVASDPNYPVLYDCVEFTHNADGMFCNTTMVDMFSVPMSLRLTGAADQRVGELRAGARDEIFADLAAREAFAPLVIADRRVIAPGHGLDAGLFPAGHLDPYIDRVWAAAEQQDLLVTTNPGTFAGRMEGGRLTFTGPGRVAFDRPTTRDVLFCNGALHAPNDEFRGPIAAVLGAGFNRGTLVGHQQHPVTDPAAFYRTAPTNRYAAAMHAAALDGRAYGFAFDDVGGFASYLEDRAPQQVTLVLTPF